MNTHVILQMIWQIIPDLVTKQIRYDTENGSFCRMAWSEASLKRREEIRGLQVAVELARHNPLKKKN